MQVQKSIPQHINKVVSMKERIYFLLNPIQTNYKNIINRAKKRIWQLVLVLTLNFLKSSFLHIESTFFQEFHAPLKLDLKVSPIARPYDALLNLKKYNNKILLKK
jgi:hypothetical protein